MRLTKQCFGCKEQFRKTELIDYAAPGTVTMHSYCPKCLAEKHARERFSAKIQELFGELPGPQVWTERKRIIEKYGYTDDTIIECLEYIYNIEKKVKKIKETLYFVTPPMVDKAKKWKKSEEYQAMSLARAAAESQKSQEYIVPIQKSKIKTKELLNADDYLE